MSEMPDAGAVSPPPPALKPRTATLTAAQLVLVLRAEQCRRWLAGERIAVEVYRQQHPALAHDADALLDLVYSEFLLREELGEAPSPDEYAARFPELAERLRQQIEFHRLLSETSDDGTDSLAGAPARPGSATRKGTALEFPSLSRVIGRVPLVGPTAIKVPGYEIMGELGRGGMGVVFLARQQSLQRLVALKMIRLDVSMEHDELERFRAEAEAVARLQHPHIVQVYESGEQQGQPWFSLEYVSGGTLTQKLNGEPQPSAEAAALVETLSRAMHHAHQQGIVHRDLKPGNILRTGDGVPKIADFGLAKRLEVASTQTQTGTIVGTPSYMAPEQATGRNYAIDARTDVYALGAILYEMLTGRPPFRGATPLDTLQLVASQEPVPPRRLNPQVPRDLETICLKCLEKGPARRYASALDLADDLERLRLDRPIRARPTSAAEHLRKWAWRRPAAALLVLLAMLAVPASYGLGWWHIRQLQQERDRADEQRAEAKKQRDHALKRYRQAREAVDQMLVRVGERSLFNTPQMEQVSQGLLQDALGFYQQFLQEDSTDPELRQEAAHVYYRVGTIHRMLGQPDKAVDFLQKALAMQQQLAGEPGLNRQRLLDDPARTYTSLGQVHRDQGRDAAAAEAYRRALALRRQRLEEAPQDIANRLELANVYDSLAALHRAAGQRDKAEESLKQGITILGGIEHDAPNHPAWRRDLATEYCTLAVLLVEANRPQEAERQYRLALNVLAPLLKQDPQRPSNRELEGLLEHNLALLLFNQGRLADAEKLVQRSLEVRQGLVADYPGRPNYRLDVTHALTLQARLYLAAGQKEQAEKTYRDVLRLRKKLASDYPAVTEYHRAYAATLSALALLRRSQGDLAEARQLLEEAVRSQRHALQANPRNPAYRSSLLTHYANLAETLLRLGNHAAAVATAAELPRLYPDGGMEYYAAARYTARAVALAAADKELADDERDRRTRQYTDQAIAQLRQAIAKGYRPGKDLQTNPHWQAVKEDAGFVRLLKELAPAP